MVEDDNEEALVSCAPRKSLNPQITSKEEGGDGGDSLVEQPRQEARCFRSEGREYSNPIFGSMLGPNVDRWLKR